MKLNLRSLILLLLSVYAFSCIAQVAHNDSIIAKLKKDKYFHAFRKSQTLFMLKMLSGRYHITPEVQAKLDATLPKAKNMQDVVTCYRLAGATHYYEYLGYPKLIRLYEVILKSEYPQLFKMSYDERTKIFDEAAAARDTEKLTDDLMTAYLLKAHTK